MNGLSLLLCASQITLLMLFAGLVARWLRRQTPDASAAVGLIGLIAAVVLTVLTIIDVPRPFESQVRLDSQPFPVAIDAPQHNDVETTSTAESEGGRSPRIGFELSLTDTIRDLLRETSTSHHASTPLAWWSGALWCGAVMIGLLPLFLGMVGTIQLHFQSRPIEGDEAACLTAGAKLQNGAKVTYRCSRFIEAPCVTFFGGRTIYLPVDWNQWPARELAAAIAHEAAHLNRHDPLTRLIGQTATPLLCFHPLAIWLCRGVLLSQEMAADRDAAARQGTSYRRSLSQMALRFDAACDRGPRHTLSRHALRKWFLRPGIVSVSSSHLIRRIEMLTKHPMGNSSRKFAVLSQLTLVSLLALCASWTVRADQPDGPDKAEAKKATARIARLPERDLGKRPPFARQRQAPWDDLGDNDSGYAAVDVVSLLQQPFVGAALPSAIEPYLDIAWKAVARDAASGRRAELGLAINNVRRIVGTVNYSMSKEEPDDESEALTSVKIGSEGAKFWFAQPVSHDAVREAFDAQKIAEMIEQGGTTREDIGGKDFPEFVTEFLSKTFTDGATTAELLIPPPEKEADQSQFARLKRGWNAVDGGIITICYSLPEKLGFIEHKEDVLVEAVLKHAACLSMGAELDPDGGPVDIRVALVPRANISPAATQDAIQALIDGAEVKFTELLASDDTDQATVESIKKVRAILGTMEMSTTASSNNGEQDCVFISCQSPLDMLQVIIGI